MSSFSDYVATLLPKAWWRLGDTALSSVDDTFTGTDGDRPNSDLWRFSHVPNASTVSAVSQIKSNKLNHKIVRNTTAGAISMNDILLYHFTGDYSIQVDFDTVTEGQDGYFWLNSAKWVGAIEKYDGTRSFATNVTGSNSYVARTNTYGKLKFVRTGSTGYAYYQDGAGSMTLLNSGTVATTDVSVILGTYFGTTFNSGELTIEANFDNFTVISGDYTLTQIREEVEDNLNYRTLIYEEPLLQQASLVYGDTDASIKFNGDDQYVKADAYYAPLNITGDLTAFFLIKKTAVGASNEVIVCHGGDTEAEANNYTFNIFTTSTGNITLFHENSGGVDNSVSLDLGITAGVIYAVAIVRDVSSKTVYGYVDGALTDSGTYTNNPTGGTTGKLWMGVSASTGSSEFFDGIIDELSIFDKTLTANQIATMSSHALGSSSPAPVEGSDFATYASSLNPKAWWRLGESNTPANIDDDFTGADGSVPDEDLWYQTITGSVSDATIQSNKLNLTDTSSNTGITYTIQRNGILPDADFDVQIDFDITTWSNTTAANRVAIGTGGIRIYLGLRNDTAGYKYYFSGFHNAWANRWSVLSNTTTHTTGKLRLKRVGTTITAYYWSGTQWEWNGSTAGNSQTYIAFTEESFQGFTVYFDKGEASYNINMDNFTVNSGTFYPRFANDETGNYDGEYINTPTLGQPSLVSGDIDTSVYFAEANEEYVKAPPALMTELLTHTTGSIGFIFKYEDNSAGVIDSGNVFFVDDSVVNEYMEFVIHGTEIYYAFRDGTDTQGVDYFKIATTLSLSDGDVYHCVFVQDATDGCLIYLNGVKLSTTTSLGTPGNKWFSNLTNITSSDWFTTQAFIRTGYYEEYYTGTMDEVMVFDYQLTSEEVRNLSNYALTGEVPNTSVWTDYINSLTPTAWWRMADVDIKNFYIAGEDGTDPPENWVTYYADDGASDIVHEMQNGKFVIEADATTGTHPIFYVKYPAIVVGDFVAEITVDPLDDNGNTQAGIMFGNDEYIMFAGNDSIRCKINEFNSDSVAVDAVPHRLKIERVGDDVSFFWKVVGGTYAQLNTTLTTTATTILQFGLIFPYNTIPGFQSAKFYDYVGPTSQGTICHEEIGGYHGTYKNKPLLDQKSLVVDDPNGCVEFDSTKYQGVALPTSFVNEIETHLTGTITGIVEIGDEDGACLFSTNIYSNHDIYMKIAIDTTNLYFIWANNSETPGTAYFSLKTPHGAIAGEKIHFAVVQNDTASIQALMYINGVLSETTLTGTPNNSRWFEDISSDRAGISYLDRSLTQPDNLSHDGKVDEMMVFNYRLSADEIAQMYNIISTGELIDNTPTYDNNFASYMSALEPLAWWRLGENSIVPNGSYVPDGLRLHEYIGRLKSQHYFNLHEAYSAGAVASSEGRDALTMNIVGGDAGDFQQPGSLVGDPDTYSMYSAYASNPYLQTPSIINIYWYQGGCSFRIKLEDVANVTTSTVVSWGGANDNGLTMLVSRLANTDTLNLRIISNTVAVNDYTIGTLTTGVWYTVGFKTVDVGANTDVYTHVNNAVTSHGTMTGYPQRLNIGSRSYMFVSYSIAYYTTGFGGWIESIVVDFSVPPLETTMAAYNRIANGTVEDDALTSYAKSLDPMFYFKLSEVEVFENRIDEIEAYSIARANYPIPNSKPIVLSDLFPSTKFHTANSNKYSGTLTGIATPTFPFSITATFEMPTGVSTSAICTAFAIDGSYAGIHLVIGSGGNVDAMLGRQGGYAPAYRRTTNFVNPDFVYDEPHMVTVVWTGFTDAAIAYVNGKKLTSPTQSGTATYYQTGQLLHIGNTCYGTRSGMYTSDVMFMDYYPSESEIQSLHSYVGSSSLLPITAIDEMGNYDGTYINSPTFGQQGLVLGDLDTCVHFTRASSQCVTTEFITPADSTMSVTCIYKPTTIDSWTTLFSDSRDDGWASSIRLAISISNTDFSLVIGDGTGSFWQEYQDQHGMVAGGEYHIALVIDVTNVKLYINSVIIKEYTSTVSLGTLGTNKFSIGRAGEYDGGYINSDMDEVVIHGKALTAEEVLNIYNYAKYGSSNLTTAYTPHFNLTVIGSDWDSPLAPVSTGYVAGLAVAKNGMVSASMAGVTFSNNTYYLDIYYMQPGKVLSPESTCGNIEIEYTNTMSTKHLENGQIIAGNGYSDFYYSGTDQCVAGPNTVDMWTHVRDTVGNQSISSYNDIFIGGSEVDPSLPLITSWSDYNTGVYDIWIAVQHSVADIDVYSVGNFPLTTKGNGCTPFLIKNDLPDDPIQYLVHPCPGLNTETNLDESPIYTAGNDFVFTEYGVAKVTDDVGVTISYRSQVWDCLILRGERLLMSSTLSSGYQDADVRYPVFDDYGTTFSHYATLPERAEWTDVWHTRFWAFAAGKLWVVANGEDPALPYSYSTVLYSSEDWGLTWTEEVGLTDPSETIDKFGIFETDVWHERDIWNDNTIKFLVHNDIMYIYGSSNEGDFALDADWNNSISGFALYQIDLNYNPNIVTEDNLPVVYDDVTISNCTATSLTLTIAANSVSTITEYMPVLITLTENLDSGSCSVVDMFDDLGDLWQDVYIKDGITNLRAYFEEWDPTNYRARIWVIVPFLDTNARDLTLEFDTPVTDNPLSKLMNLIAF